MNEPDIWVKGQAEYDQAAQRFEQQDMAALVCTGCRHYDSLHGADGCQVITDQCPCTVKGQTEYDQAQYVTIIMPPSTGVAPFKMWPGSTLQVNIDPADGWVRVNTRDLDPAVVERVARALHAYAEASFVKPGRRQSWDSPLTDREGYLAEARAAVAALAES